MEPTIYKPSIYNGAGIYKAGAEGGGGSEVVSIGGEDYDVVTIGNLKWITRNLNFKYTGMVETANESTSGAGCYYQVGGNNQTGYGLLYNCMALNFIQSNLRNGWRIPESSDFDNLVSSVNNDIFALLSKFGFQAGNKQSNNSSGLSLYGGGYHYGGGAYNDIDYTTQLWCKFNLYNNTPYKIFQCNGSYSSGIDGYKNFRSVRICKNA